MEFPGFALAALAALIGLSLGLLGGGGSILTVPVLVYVQGFGAKTAIAMSLPVVGATSLIGALSHWRGGNTRFRAALFLGVTAMAGSYLGARLSVFLSGPAQLIMLAVVMLAAAASMLRSPAGRAFSKGEKGSEGAVAARTPVPKAKLLAVGFGIGVLTGIVGTGGGFLIVPALVVLARVPVKQAVGTSLLVIAMNSASAFAGYAGTVDIPWKFVMVFTAVALAGILAGTHLLRFVSPGALKRGFAVFLLAIAGLLLYQNHQAVTGLISHRPDSRAPGIFRA